MLRKRSSTTRRNMLLGAVVASSLVISPFAALAQDSAAVQAAPAKPPGPNRVAKQKVIWLFGRRKDFSRERFRREYVEIHAPLGLRYTQGLLGYTVNLVDSAPSPDAFTEQWVPSVEDFTNPKTAYATPADFAKVQANHIIEGLDLYVVDEKVVRGKPLSGPLGKATPGVKVVWLYRHAQPVPPPPAGAYRVVDNRVLRNVVFQPDHAQAAGTSGIELIRMAWARDLAHLGPAAASGVVVTEYRFRASPWK